MTSDKAAQATSERLWVRWSLIGVAILFLGFFLFMPLAVVFAYFTYPRSDNAGPGPDTRSGNQGRGKLKSFGLWRSTVIVMSAIPIAILTNVVRVSGTGVLARFYGTRVADGFFHSFSGWVMYIVAFLMLFGAGWLIDRCAVHLISGPTAINGGAQSQHQLMSEPPAVAGG